MPFSVKQDQHGLWHGGHEQLLSLRGAYFPPEEGQAPGTCNGASSMYLNAFFSHDMKSFDDRFNLLGEYADKPQELKKDIDKVYQKNIAKAQAKKKAREGTPLSDEEEKHMEKLSSKEEALQDVPPFLESMHIQQQGIDYPLAKKERAIARQDYLARHEHSAPRSLEGEKKPVLLNKSTHAFNKEECKEHFKNLEGILEQSDHEKIGIFMKCDNHAIAATYDKDRGSGKKLEFFDINKLGYRQDAPNSASLPVSNEQLGDEVRAGLDDKDTSIFSMEIIGEKTDPTLTARLKEENQKSEDLLGKKNARSVSALHMAVQHSDKESVTELCNELNRSEKTNEEGFVDVSEKLPHEIINERNSAGFTPLICAVDNKDLSMARKLVEEGAGLEVPDASGRTPLALAKQKKDKEMQNLLIKKGAKIRPLDKLIHHAKERLNLSVDAVNANSVTPESPVVTDEEESSADKFQGLKKEHEQSSTLADKKGQAFLNRACAIDPKELEVEEQKELSEAKKDLLKKGADANHVDKEGETPLSHTVKNEDVDTANALMMCGADVNKETQGKTPLHHAMDNDDAPMCHALMKNGADLNEVREDGVTPAFIAARSGDMDMLKKVKKEEIDKSLASGERPIHAAAANGHAEMTGELIKRGADVNKVTAEGTSPVFAAVCSGDKDTVAHLAKAGADVNTPINNGLSPVGAAVMCGHKDMIAPLSQVGADVNAPANNGKTPLMLAAVTGQKELVNPLCEAGADLNQKTSKGDTALSLADSFEQAETAKTLREHGAREIDRETEHQLVDTEKKTPELSPDDKEPAKENAQADTRKKEPPAAYDATYAQGKTPEPTPKAKVKGELDDYIKERKNENSAKDQMQDHLKGRLGKAGDPKKAGPSDRDVDIKTAQKVKRSVDGKLEKFNARETKSAQTGKLGDIVQNRALKTTRIPSLEKNKPSPKDKGPKQRVAMPC